MIITLDVVVGISTLEVVEIIPTLDVFVVVVDIVVSDEVIIKILPDEAAVTPNGVVVVICSHDYYIQIIYKPKCMYVP